MHEFRAQFNQLVSRSDPSISRSRRDMLEKFSRWISGQVPEASTKTATLTLVESASKAPPEEPSAATWTVVQGEWGLLIRPKKSFRAMGAIEQWNMWILSLVYL